LLLTIDVGNSNITLGLYNEKLVETFRLVSDKELEQTGYEAILATLFKPYEIEECIIGSVVHELDEKLVCACKTVFNIEPILFNDICNLGLNICIKNPEEVGADRIANAIAAKQKYKLPAIVVDIGTATTFDIVSKEGDFLGGVIMPGLNLQFKSLCANTSKLPHINAGHSEKAIGDSTENAMLSGIMRGSACAIEGLIHQCELELGEKATIIATGGHSKLISDYMFRQFDYIDSNLTLDGLKYLYELNALALQSKC
jgi:type III pantothenate kinase